MIRSMAQVLDEALELSNEERAKLVSEEAWAEEIERRIARIDAGQAKLLGMDEAIDRMHRAARS